MYFPSTTHLIEFLRAIKSHVVEKYLMTWKQCSWHMDKWQNKKKTHHKVRAAESKLCERCVYIWLWKEGKIWKHIVVFFYFAFLHPSASGPGMITDAKRKNYSLAFDIQNRHLYLRWAWKLGTGKRGSFSTSVALHKGLQGREMGDFREKKLCLQSWTDHGQTEPSLVCSGYSGQRPLCKASSRHVTNKTEILLTLASIPSGYGSPS